MGALSVVLGIALPFVPQSHAQTDCEPRPAFLAGINGSLLVRLDPAGGQSVAISNMGLRGYASEVAGLTYDPADHTLYAYDSLSGYLVSVGPESGTVAPIGPTGFAAIRGLAIDPNRGVLYGIDSAAAQLIVLDKSTGSGTSLAALGSVQLAGLAYDSALNSLYAIDLADGRLLRIHPTSGAVTAAPAPTGFSEVSGLAFDTASRTLYGVDAAAGQLVSIDLTTGLGFAIGQLGSGRVRSIGFDSLRDTVRGMEINTGRLITIEKLSGTATPAGLPTSFQAVSGLSYHPLSGRILGVDSNLDVLITIDADSGLAEAIGPIGWSGVRDLAVHPATGEMYAVDATGQLLTIDPTTGTGTPSGVSDLSCVAGLEFDPTLPILYATDTCSDALITVNLFDGSQAPVGALGFTNVTALAMQPGSDVLYAVDEDTGLVLTVNRFNGTGTAKASLGFGDVRSLSVGPESNGFFAVSGELAALLRINEHGLSKTVRRIGGSALSGLAYEPQADLLYGADREAQRLVQIDPRNGDSRLIGRFGGSVVIVALATDPLSGLLYGYDRSANQLMLIDRASGLATPVGPAGLPSIAGLAFDHRGALFGADDSGAVLLALDKTTGAITTVGPFGLPPPTTITGLAFDTASQTLYGSDSTGVQLVSIDRGSGAAAIVGPVLFSGLEGLEWIPPVFPAGCLHDFRYSLIMRQAPSSADTGELPAAAPTLACRQPFYVEFWARDEAAENSGITCAFADLRYDPAKVRVVDIVHSAAFGQPAFASGQDDGAGRILDLGGCHLPDSPGQTVGLQPQWVCVARVEMMPVPPQCLRSCAPEITSIATESSDLESSAYGRGRVPPEDIIYGSASAGLSCSCLYDFTDDCAVTATDLGIIAPSWRRCIGQPEYDPRADFDCNGCFAGGDIAFFATAWLGECGDPRTVIASCKGCGSASPSQAHGRAQASVATVQFALHVTDRPTETNEIMGALPSSLDHAQAGQRLFGEFWIRDLDDTDGRLVAAFADLHYAGSEFRVLEVSTERSFSLVAPEDQPGRVIGIGGVRIVPEIQPLRWLRVTSVELEALVNTAAPRIWIQPSELDPAARLGFGALAGAQIQVHQPASLLSRADLDQDGDVDRSDLMLLQLCLSGPQLPHDGTAGCRAADLDRDADVDQQDFGILQACYSGTDLVADTQCAR